MPIHDLTNKVVILTGIGAVGDGWGNGTTIAALFARQGAKVYGCDINFEAAKKAASEIREDPEVIKKHGQYATDAVDVMQQSLVGAFATRAILFIADYALGRNEVGSMQGLRRRLHAKTQSH